jgi:hypothetical protein
MIEEESPIFKEMGKMFPKVFEMYKKSLNENMIKAAEAAAAKTALQYVKNQVIRKNPLNFDNTDTTTDAERIDGDDVAVVAAAAAAYKTVVDAAIAADEDPTDTVAAIKAAIEAANNYTDTESTDNYPELFLDFMKNIQKEFLKISPPLDREEKLLSLVTKIPIKKLSGNDKHIIMMLLLSVLFKHKYISLMNVETEEKYKQNIKYIKDTLNKDIAKLEGLMTRNTVLLVISLIVMGFCLGMVVIGTKNGKGSVDKFAKKFSILFRVLLGLSVLSTVICGYMVYKQKNINDTQIKLREFFLKLFKDNEEKELEIENVIDGTISELLDSEGYTTRLNFGVNNKCGKEYVQGILDIFNNREIKDTPNTKNKGGYNKDAFAICESTDGEDTNDITLDEIIERYNKELTLLKENLSSIHILATPPASLITISPTGKNVGNIIKKNDNILREYFIDGVGVGVEVISPNPNPNPEEMSIFDILVKLVVIITIAVKKDLITFKDTNDNINTVVKKITFEKHNDDDFKNKTKNCDLTKGIDLGEKISSHILASGKNREELIEKLTAKLQKEFNFSKGVTANDINTVITSSVQNVSRGTPQTIYPEFLICDSTATKVDKKAFVKAVSKNITNDIKNMVKNKK